MITILLLFCSATYCADSTDRAHYGKIPYHVTCDHDIRNKSVTYARSCDPSFGRTFIARQNADNSYMVVLADHGDVLLDLSLSEEGLKQFWILAAEYSAQQAMKEKLCVKKTVIKEEDRENHSITYTQTKNDIKRSATRILMDNGRVFFDSDVEEEETNNDPEKLFAELEQIYVAENPEG